MALGIICLPDGVALSASFLRDQMELHTCRVRHRPETYRKKHSSELPIRFGVAVRKRRLDYGWTQDELAERAGLDRSFVSGIERGTRTVSIVTLEKIADAFKLPIAELLKEL